MYWSLTLYHIKTRLVRSRIRLGLFKEMSSGKITVHNRNSFFLHFYEQSSKLHINAHNIPSSVYNT